MITLVLCFILNTKVFISIHNDNKQTIIEHYIVSTETYICTTNKYEEFVFIDKFSKRRIIYCLLSFVYPIGYTRRICGYLYGNYFSTV